MESRLLLLLLAIGLAVVTTAAVVSRFYERNYPFSLFTIYRHILNNYYYCWLWVFVFQQYNECATVNQNNPSRTNTKQSMHTFFTTIWMGAGRDQRLRRERFSSKSCECVFTKFIHHIWMNGFVCSIKRALFSSVLNFLSFVLFYFVFVLGFVLFLHFEEKKLIIHIQYTLKKKQEKREREREVENMNEWKNGMELWTMRICHSTHQFWRKYSHLVKLCNGEFLQEHSVSPFLLLPSCARL